MSKVKIGYTTGVFDLFHIGHLNIIKRSKEACDYLIVGVTSDDEVFRKKGKTPIIPEEERMKIVEALKYVDKVVLEDDTDKILAWKELDFNVMFKGSDWKGSELWNKYEEYFSKRDVNIVYFPYTEGTSSTLLREVLDSF